jgi:flagellar biogenesis protein FliO
MGPFQPPRPQSNSKNAAIFFILTLVVFALPLLMPNHRSRPAFTDPPRPQNRAVATNATPESPASLSPSPASAVAGSSPAQSASPAEHPDSSPSVSPEASPPAVATTPAAAKTTEPELDWNQDYGPQINFKEKLQSIIINLLIITGLIFITVKFLQKFYPNIGKPMGQATPLMQVLSTTTISPGINLCLVQVCNKNMVLAITEHSVSSICEISGEDLAKAQEAADLPTESPISAGSPLTKSPKQVYGDILRHYLSIIPGMGEKQ